MQNFALKVISHQARAVYDTVAKHGPMTAAEIAQQLQVLPHTVYRAATQLINLGVLQKTSDYPVKFELFYNKNAIDWYALAARKSFADSFLPLGHLAESHSPSNPSISFIKNRTMLLQQTDKDTAAAKREINFIVSGLIVPDETVLAYRRAVTKGVRIRALVQRKKETSIKKLEEWHKLGIETKYTSDLGVRLFTFDSQVVYFTSYSSRNKDAAFGIRFDYTPLATLMNDLFEEHWVNAD
jgi:sugar-specific transcriptional regulator TrmB